MEETVNFKEIEQTSIEKFEQFYQFLYKDDLAIHGLTIQIWKNQMSNKYKLVITKNLKELVIKEEFFRQEFLFLSSLQGFDISKHFKTLLNSLEFLSFLRKFIS